jgi:hypothetical protein
MSVAPPKNDQETEPLIIRGGEIPGEASVESTPTDGRDPLEQLPGETFEAYVERTSALLNDRPEAVDQILARAEEEVARIEKAEDAATASDEALMAGALARIPADARLGQDAFAPAQEEFHALVAEQREALADLRADAPEATSTPVANAASTVGAAPPAGGEPMSEVAAESVDDAVTKTEVGEDVDEGSTTDVHTSQVVEAVAATGLTPDHLERDHAPVTPERHIPPLANDPTALHTPEEIDKECQNASQTITSLESLAATTDQAGLGEALPSSATMREWLPIDSPLRRSAQELIKHPLTPEEAIRAEVDAYGIAVRAMIELDLTSETSSEQAATAMVGLAAFFEQARLMRERLPQAARSALAAAIREASSHSPLAPSSFSSEGEVFAWADRTHHQTATLLQSRAKRMRSPDGLDVDQMSGTEPVVEKEMPAVDLSRERAKAMQVMTILAKTNRERYDRRLNVLLPVSPTEFNQRLGSLSADDGKAIAEMAKFIGDVMRRPLPNEGSRISETSENLTELLRALTAMQGLAESLPVPARETFFRDVRDWDDTKRRLAEKNTRLRKRLDAVNAYGR